MVKKQLWLVVLLLCGLLLILAACNNNGNQSAPAAPSQPADQSTTPAVEPSTAAPGPYDDYPNRNIEFIIGWGSGGGTDTFSRTINVDVKEILGVNIVEQNMPGGSSVNAMQYVLQQPADGYTLFAITNDILQNTLLGRTDMSYKDLMPIIRAHVDIGSWTVATAHAKFTTLDEFVEYAKANSGKVTLAGIGSQSNDEFLSFYVLKQMGIDVTYVPYEAASDMVAALLGGHVDMMYEEPGNVIELIKNGDVAPLVFFCEQPLADYPDVPTVAGLGYDVPPYMWRGVAVKAGTPDEIVQKLIEAYVEAWNRNRYKEFAHDRFLDLTDGLLTGQDFLDSMARDEEIMAKIIEDLGY